ncbi:MAG TPA: heavy metal-associated domain-containing protein [Phototrophicaceae bacterium]|nr:heavy metal-associated domain-containing protein [Phototrophicaceae bacterium]
MEHRSFTVPNIGCDNCVKTIVNELSQQQGVRKVEGDVETKRVTVDWEAPMTWDVIVKTLEAIDYSPAQTLMP